AGQPARHAADNAQRGTHREGHRRRRRTAARGASAHVAPRLWNAHAGGGRGPEGHPGTAGPRAALDHAALHAVDYETGAGRVRQDASESEVVEAPAIVM